MNGSCWGMGWTNMIILWGKVLSLFINFSNMIEEYYISLSIMALFLPYIKQTQPFIISSFLFIYSMQENRVQQNYDQIYPIFKLKKMKEKIRSKKKMKENKHMKTTNSIFSFSSICKLFFKIMIAYRFSHYTLSFVLS